jgi:phosphatidylglycerol lysyltransferase
VATPQALIALLRDHGTDAVSFQSLESGLSWWRDEPPPAGTGAALAYTDTGRSWIGVGTPLAPAGDRARAIARFIAAARAQRRRPVFFGVEDTGAFDRLPRIQLGLQSVLNARDWSETLRASHRLREQLRRAGAKGVTTRVVRPEELADGAPLRVEVDRLTLAWLATRPMEPLGFLVAVEPFHLPDAHLYLVAERGGTVVQFLSAVPIYGRSGWLLEDMLRSPAAPNGTTELLINTVMDAVDGRAWVTPGLTPLSGAVPQWLRWVSAITRPLYDFAGLRRFRARLHPARWDPVWLIWDRGASVPVVIDVLRAFADGRLIRFACRSLVRHPNGPPWAVAVPLVVWTGVLSVTAAFGQAPLVGFSTAELAGWIAFDAGLAWGLFRVARRPRVRGLTYVTAAAAFDMVQSIWHIRDVGLGSTPWSAVLRTLAVAGPIAGTAALLWALMLARRRG